MIRYSYDLTDIQAKISAIDPKWLGKAAARAERFIARKAYKEANAIWSVVKPVFMLIQQNKCAFCERQLERDAYGKIEFDLEHFRPKSSVQAWPVVGRHQYVYDFQTGDAEPDGYYWLAYEIGNYAASCKACNTMLKSNFFPVAGQRLKVSGDPKTEKPFLCYPLGDSDDDPEHLVTFIATTAVPVAKSGHKHRRGRIIIDFFDLNVREQLHRERAQLILLLGNALDAIAAGRDDDGDKELVVRLNKPEYPHVACLRAFNRLWARDQAFARKVLKACKAYVASVAGTAPPQV